MSTFWTNRSVLELSADRDPESAIIDKARSAIFDAIEHGWTGPPFDPFELAELRGISVVAREDLYDARVVPVGRSGDVHIEYNPSRPLARQRYSVAHEIAHTFFNDVADAARYRSRRDADGGDAWQLELLCNLAAAEILMPVGAFPELRDEALDIDHLMALRQEFGVSTEAMLLRVAKLTAEPVGVFAASRVDGNRLEATLQLEYIHGSRAWRPRMRRGTRLPRHTALTEVTAIGYTVKGHERWPVGDVDVEAVGLPPYPGQRAPRIAGVVRATARRPVDPSQRIEHVRGDATEPRRGGTRLIAHVVNDKTPNWGGAFARALRSRYPEAQEQFRTWAADPQRLKLGRSCIERLDGDVRIASMVAQHGYGPSAKARIRYGALEACLRAVAEAAASANATIHMPRIGVGQAGGQWSVVEELIDAELVQRGLKVTVYSLPGERWTREGEQTALALL